MMNNSDMVSISRDDLSFIVNTIVKICDGEVVTDEEKLKLKELAELKSTSRSDLPSIGSVLKQLGVRPGILGYDYLKTAIDLCIEDRSLIQNITKGLYPAIAKVHDTTPSRAERAMRHAVEVAFDSYGDETLRDAIFGNSTDPNKGKPTNTHFIAAVVEYYNEG